MPKFFKAHVPVIIVRTMSAILDDLKEIASIDREGMCKIVERFPEQCKEAIKIAEGLVLPREVKIPGKTQIGYDKPANIIVAGMGGSAIGGNLLKDWLRNRLTVPIEVCRGYHLPAYAGEETLVLAVSYSGNTEETLTAYLEAIDKGCMTIAVTSGGLLQEFSKKLGVPYVWLPSGYPPRSAIAYLFFPLVYSLEKLRLIQVAEEVEETVASVTELRDEVKLETPTSLNPSKKLAIGLKDSIPFICGFDLYESVALRIKTQLNENSKIPAKTESFPELNHNETVGWTGSRDLTKNFSVVLIRDDWEEPVIRTRIDVTRSLVFDEGAKEVLEIRGRGRGRLARMLSAMYIGDYASIYLAILNHIDPTPVTIIDKLKNKLEEEVNKTSKLKKRFEKLRLS